MKKYILLGIVMIMLVSTCMARVEPTYVTTDQYGIEPATYLAAIVGICALLNNYGRYLDKKRADPSIKYDYAYLNTTILSVLLMCMTVLQTPVVELTPYAVLGAVLIGFGGNEAITRVTKVKADA